MKNEGNHDKPSEIVEIKTSNGFPTMVFTIDHVNDVTDIHDHLTKARL